jgi:glycosyltransferase involved in cell wall biosynthesis
MIVKNEALVIGRCLTSVLAFIDCWIIVDTGSTDGTQHLVRQHLASRPGTLYERPWRNFAHNRNEALALARQAADYMFFIDADERLFLPPDFSRPVLDADGYHIETEYSGLSYSRGALVNSRLPWRWTGVVHEVLDCNRPVTWPTLAGPRIIVAHDGARSRDPNTYANDVALLEEALQANPGSTRDTFYLAQSYRDSGDLARSRKTYEQRARMGGWDEEVWYSLYQVAVLGERLGSVPHELTAAYLQAFQNRPTRAEPLVQLARYHRQRQEYALAFLYARHGAAIRYPSDRLFVETDAYRWRALDELAISGYYCGEQQAGADALRRLLAQRVFPDSERQRILQNATFYGIEAI